MSDAEAVCKFFTSALILIGGGVLYINSDGRSGAWWIGICIVGLWAM